ncbi:MAG: DUF4143 domain-containing protein [Propionibacteriaceae bacterium]|nr:DUF4143 domain-containing protein [Propionibacteriaceae bacterium]
MDDDVDGGDYLERLVDPVLDAALEGLPAISLVGPRACGKTTSARRRAKQVVRLNKEAEAAAFAADPDAALARLEEPALLDEWQEVNPVLGAVKRSVDDDARAGRFILTGSVTIETDTDTWAATGRVTRVAMYPLTQREILGVASPLFVDRVLKADAVQLEGTADRLELFDYLGMAVRGGFPDAALKRSGLARELWLASYLEELLSRDAKRAGAGTAIDYARLNGYATALAASSAKVVDDATLRDSAHVDRRTAAGYDRRLEAVFFSERVPAWWSEKLTSLTALPKRYVVDASLMASLLRADVDAIAARPGLLGQVVDTFVASQLRPEAAVSGLRPALHHLRDKGGRHEVDILLDYGARGVVGIEVKASSAPSLADARHLCWLRDRLGDRFAAGVVLHTGPSAFRLSDKISAAPISAIWAA